MDLNTVANILQIGDFLLDVTEVSNEEIMKMLLIQNKEYLQKIIKQNKEIIKLLKKESVIDA